MNRTSVLLIDDDPDMATIAGRVVEKAGFHFIWARTAEEGLAEVIAKSPSVVLLDHMLPDMTGIEFLRTLRSHPTYVEFRDLPVMMLTAYEAKRRDLEAMYRYGLAVYLQKPFGHRELVNLIWNVCEQQRFRKATLEKESPRVADEEPGALIDLLQRISSRDFGKLQEQPEMAEDLQELRRLSDRLLEKLASGSAGAPNQD
jgi:DNA-binding response OmpR family regulator